MTQITSETPVAQARPETPAMVVVRLGEVTLKKRNRPFFVKQVARNVRRAAGGLDVRDVSWGPNRVLLTPGRALDWPELRARLALVGCGAGEQSGGRKDEPDNRRAMRMTHRTRWIVPPHEGCRTRGPAPGPCSPDLPRRALSRQCLTPEYIPV